MSRVAYAHAYTGGEDCAGAFCPAIAAPACDDEVRLVVRRWEARTNDEHNVSITELPNLVARLYTTQTQLVAYSWARLPSGNPLTLGVRLTDDRYTALSSRARWRSVPKWRVTKGELGVTVVTVPESSMERTVIDFYSALRDLLLD